MSQGSNICTSQTQCSAKDFWHPISRSAGQKHANSGQSGELKVSLPSIAGGSQKYGINKVSLNEKTNNFVGEKTNSQRNARILTICFYMKDSKLEVLDHKITTH